MNETKNIRNFIRKNQYITDNPEIGAAIINFIVGDHIGSGTSRNVYQYNLDKRYVVKIETPDALGDNWAEWRIWGTVKDTTDGTKNWFAECTWISDDGKVMLQRKTEPLVSKKSKIPERIPAWFTDLKAANFGWIGNQVVCHDYSYCIERFGYFALGKKTQIFKNKLYQ